MLTTNCGCINTARKGNYAYCTGRLQGLIKNAIIALDYGTAPDLVSAMLKRVLAEATDELEGNNAALEA